MEGRLDLYTEMAYLSTDSSNHLIVADWELNLLIISPT